MEWYARRLANKRKGRRHRKHSPSLSRAATSASASFVLALSTSFSLLDKNWDITLPLSVLLAFTSLMHVMRWSVANLNRFTYRDSTPTIKSYKIKGYDVMLPTTAQPGDSIERAMYEVVRLSFYVLGCAGSCLFGSIPSVSAQWLSHTVGPIWLEHSVDVLQLGKARARRGLSRLETSLNFLVETWSYLRPIDDLFKQISLPICQFIAMLWRIIKLLAVDFNDEWLTKTTPPLLWHFVMFSWQAAVLVVFEFKDKWFASTKSEGEGELLDNLLHDINEIFATEEEPWDWQLLSKPQDLGCMLALRLPREYPETEIVCISDEPELIPSNGRQRAGFFEDGESKEWLDLLLSKQDEKLDSLINQALVGIPLAEPTIKDASISPNDRFIGSFNPAVAGADLLMVERYDQRTAPKKGKKRRKVSVHLQECRSSMRKHFKANVCLFPAYEEFVLNVVGPSALPLIVDTGASCCVSPCREDFIEGTYRSSEVKIKDLSGVNKVAGKGMLRWPVQDKFGRVHDIEIQGYHVPNASVRLLSPQSLIKKFGGNGWFDEYKFAICIKKFGVELHAPYGLANLPILPMSAASSAYLDCQILSWSMLLKQTSGVVASSRHEIKICHRLRKKFCCGIISSHNPA
jgi:hypothetical protein